MSPQYDGTLPFQYALETFFAPDYASSDAVRVQLEFDRWNCYDALVTPAMHGVDTFGIVCSVFLFALTVGMLFHMRREPTSLPKVAMIVEGVIAAPFRAYKGVLDPFYVVPNVNLVFASFISIFDELVSHVANTIVTSRSSSASWCSRSGAERGSRLDTRSRPRSCSPASFWGSASRRSSTCSRRSPYSGRPTSRH